MTTTQQLRDHEVARRTLVARYANLLSDVQTLLRGCGGVVLTNDLETGQHTDLAAWIASAEHASAHIESTVNGVLSATVEYITLTQTLRAAGVEPGAERLPPDAFTDRNTQTLKS